MIILALVSLTCFVPTFGLFLFAISYREGPFSETDELPMIFIKFRKIAGNLPLFDGALFRTLIAAGDSPFQASFYPSPRGPVFVPKCGPFLFAISLRKGPFLETDELPLIFIKFRQIVANLPLFGEALF